MEKPLPCPFCGEINIRVIHYPRLDTFNTRCPFCLAEGPLKGNADYAMGAWNKRVADAK